MQFIVYFTKHHTKLTMRYGIYESFYQASQALIKAKEVNPYDEWYIEERFIK